MLPSRSKAFYCIQEIIFSFLEPIENSLPRVFGELTVFYDKLMEIVSKKVGAGVAAVTVEHSEEGALWPVFDVFLLRWLHDVQDNAYSVFVVVTDYSLVGVGCVPHYAAIFSDTALSRFPSR